MTPPRPAHPSEQPAGSPIDGEPAFVVIGRLLRPHGVHGEILMEAFTDFPERIQKGKIVYIGEDFLPVTIRSYRMQLNQFIISLDGFYDRDEIGRFRNQIVFIRVDDIPPLEPGEYYHHQVLGLQVIDASGSDLGSVTDILETGANDVLVITTQRGDQILLPFIDSVILEVDLARSLIQVDLLPGLISEE